ncbi:MAG: tetratricopeptide repeat protein [Nitrosomonadales bacterium]|nr:MAG: tetratricopeptide repeat protein [Nitrosomonadales bacterium]
MPPHRKLLLAIALAMPLFATPALAVQNSGSKDNQKNQEGVSAEFVYKYLIGEISGQRGDFALAGNLFFELAKSSRDPRLAERATRVALYANQPQFALRAGNLWAELDPESTEAHQTVTQLLIAADKLNDAKPHLQKLLAVENTRANGFLYLNGLLSRHNDKQVVLKLVQELAKPYPDLPEARFAIAHAAWSDGKDKLALEELRAADEARPGWEISALLHGQILLRQSVSDTVAFYQEFLNQYPQAHDVRLTFAKLLVNDRRFDSAREQFVKITESAASDPEIHVVVGLLAFQQGDYEQAEKYLHQALDLGFKDGDKVYLYLGQIAERQLRDDQAQGWYQRVQPGDHYLDAQLRIATVLAHQNQLDKARALLHDLTDISSEQQVIVLQTEANLLVQAKYYQEAYELLGKAVASLPNSTELIYDYAMVAERVQRFDVMEHELRKLILINPEYAQAYNALGYTLADRNERLGEATKLIEKALALSPDDHFILDSMGWLQYRLGRLDQAVDFLQRAYTVQTDPEIAAHLGEVLWQQGNHDAALKTWEDALKEHPDNEVLINTSKKFQR